MNVTLNTIFHRTLLPLRKIQPSFKFKQEVNSRLNPNECFLSTNENHHLPVLTLYTKDPCPLCEEALEVLSPYLHQVTLEKVDITKVENKCWWKEYRYDIPVFHLDGKFLMKHKANVQVLLKALDKIAKPTRK